jgi:hypothetical protein
VNSYTKIGLCHIAVKGNEISEQLANEGLESRHLFHVAEPFFESHKIQNDARIVKNKEKKGAL